MRIYITVSWCVYIYIHIMVVYIMVYIYIYTYIHYLVGGIPTPLKNDGVRQLG